MVLPTNLIIVAFIFHKNLLVRCDPRRPVNGAGCDAGGVFAVLLPKQAGTAGGAEATACGGGGLIPSQCVVAGQVEAVIGDLCRRPVVAAGFAALGAVAGNAVTQRLGKFIGDATAQACSGYHFSFPKTDERIWCISLASTNVNALA